MNKATLIIAGCLALFGCGQPYQPYQFNGGSIGKEKAIVILSLGPINAEASIVKFANEDHSHYQTHKGQYWATAYRLNPTTYWNLKTITPQVMLIEPGYYAFTELLYYSGNTTYTSEGSPAVTFTNGAFQLTWGGFLAEAGKVTYVGELALKPNSEGFSLAHSYDDEKIATYIRNIYPALSTQISYGTYFEPSTYHPNN